MTADIIALADRLPKGRKIEDALARAVIKRDCLAKRGLDEEACQELIDYCTGLFRGDELAGKLLASAAVYES